MWENCLTKFFNQHQSLLAIFTFAACFALSLSLLCFQRIYTAGIFVGEKIGGMSYKVWAVSWYHLGHILGKVISNMLSSSLQKRQHFWIIVFISISELLLLLFGAIPAPGNFSMILLNGIPHGFIWQLIFNSSTSKRFPEYLEITFQCSLILSSGIVKSIGRSLIQSGTDEYWAPSVICGVVSIIFLASIVILESLPAFSSNSNGNFPELPSMTKNDRREFFQTLSPGLICWIVVLSILISLRNFRDSFAVDFYFEWNQSNAIYCLFLSELISAIIVAAAIILINRFISNTFTRLIAYHICGFVGFLLMLICGFLCSKGSLNGLVFMIMSGIGCFLAYVPLRTFLHKSLVSVFQFSNSANFFVYYYTLFGSFVTFLVSFLKGLAAESKQFAKYFGDLSFYLGIIGLVLLIGAFVFLLLKHKKYTPIDDGLSKQLNQDENQKLDVKNEDDEEEGPVYVHPNSSSTNLNQQLISEN